MLREDSSSQTQGRIDQSLLHSTPSIEWVYSTKKE